MRRTQIPTAQRQNCSFVMLNVMQIRRTVKTRFVSRSRQETRRCDGDANSGLRFGRKCQVELRRPVQPGGKKQTSTIQSDPTAEAAGSRSRPTPPSTPWLQSSRAELVSERIKDSALAKHNIRPFPARKPTGGRFLLSTHLNNQTIPMRETTPPFVGRRREQCAATGRREMQS